MTSVPNADNRGRVDPKTQPFLDYLAKAPKIDLKTTPISEYRAQIHAFLQQMNDSPPDLRVIRDGVVRGAQGDLPVRIYDDEDGAARPTLVFFHGGGFVRGDIASHDPLCRRLAKIGKFRVISVEYRLAPETPFPGAPLDAIAATRSILDQPATYGADTARLAVGGDSAGGNLAAVVARELAQTDRKNIAFQLLLYPVLQSGVETPSRSTFADGYMLTREGMDWFESLYFHTPADTKSPLASPIFHDVPEGLASALILTAGFDPISDDGAIYARMLKAAGIACVHRCYADQIHGFMSLTRFSSFAEEAIAEAANAVAKAMRAG